LQTQIFHAQIVEAMLLLVRAPLLREYAPLLRRFLVW
jgi:hypothetical protein